jgi:hypothetical protein
MSKQAALAACFVYNSVMPKRGPKPKGKVTIKWSSDFAYAIGLLATDGCVSSDGRHISFTSKDLEQVTNFMSALKIDNPIGRKSRGGSTDKQYFVVQFSDVRFLAFLSSIGIGPAKSKTLGPISVPSVYFFDFLRGVFDGDGYVHSYFDQRWQSSFLWYFGLCSAAPAFLEWIRLELSVRLGITGHITRTSTGSCAQLKYAKTEAAVIVSEMYKDAHSISLSRKKLKIEAILATMSRLRTEKFHIDRITRGWRN